MAPRSSAHCSCGVLDVLHAGRIQPQRDFQVLGGHGDEILSDVLLRIRVLTAAQLRIDRGDLIRAQPRASAKRHVFLRMGHSRETRGRFVAARQVVLLHGDHRRQRIPHNHHAQTILQGGPDNRVAGLLLGRGHTRDHERGERQ